jgi:hypothetical protein
VSNIAWALATAGHRDDALFEQLLAHCLSDIGAYDVQGLSNLLWACATLGHRDPTFLQAVLQVRGKKGLNSECWFLIAAMPTAVAVTVLP